MIKKKQLFYVSPPTGNLVSRQIKNKSINKLYFFFFADSVINKKYIIKKKYVLKNTTMV